MVRFIQAILNEMTQDPTAPEHPRTTILTEKPHTDKKEKLSEVPSKMVALLHKALLEQKHDEADRKEEFEEDQQDLKIQQAKSKKQVHSSKQEEDPNMELARYIEAEEAKSKARRSALRKIAAKHAAAGKSVQKPTALSKSATPSQKEAHSGKGSEKANLDESSSSTHPLPGDDSLESEVHCSSLFFVLNTRFIRFPTLK